VQLRTKRHRLEPGSAQKFGLQDVKRADFT